MYTGLIKVTSHEPYKHQEIRNILTHRNGSLIRTVVMCFQVVRVLVLLLYIRHVYASDGKDR